jgi:hypothetical protein
LKDEAPTELNAEATKLVTWTTEQVLPSFFAARKRAPLQELDLSRISFANDSMAMELDASLDETALPQLTPVAPPRKKGNRNATPERLDGNFDEIARGRTSKRKDSKVLPGDAAILSLRCLPFGLLQSSCLLLSDWLAIGAGSRTNLTSILEAVMKWFSIFDNACLEDDDENGHGVPAGWNDFNMDLLPTFAKLCFVLCVQAENFKLFEQFLSMCLKVSDDKDKERLDWIGGIVQKLASKLLKSKSTATGAAVAEVVRIVLEGAYSVLATVEGRNEEDASKVSVDDSFALPSTMRELICDSNRGDVVGCALHAVATHRQGSLLLAQRVFENFSGHFFPPENVEEGGASETGFEKNTTASEERGNAEADAGNSTEAGGEESDSEGSTAILLFEATCLYLLWDSGACRKEPAMQGVLRDLANLDRTKGKCFFDNSAITFVVEQIIEGIE